MIVFDVIGGTVVLSSIGAGWGLAPVTIAAFLACNVRCGKWMRSCVVSLTTPLSLIKSNPIKGPVKFLITTNNSARVLSLMSNLSVAVDIGFSNWPFATWICKLGGSLILKMLAIACCLIFSNSVWAIALT